MAEIDNTAVIGPFAVRPTAYTDGLSSGGALSQLDKLNQYDGALGNSGHDRMHYAPSSFFIWSHFVITDTNNNAKESLIVAAPWPLTIWAADIGCESAAGSAGTIDIEVDGASILDAASDVKTTAGTAVRVAPEVGEDDVTYGQTVNILSTGTGAGAMLGSQAHMYCQRL